MINLVPVHRALVHAKTGPKSEIKKSPAINHSPFIEWLNGIWHSIISYDSYALATVLELIARDSCVYTTIIM